MHSVNYAVIRCPSVHPSVRHMWYSGYSTKMAKCIIKLFFTIGEPQNSSFSIQYDNIPIGNPLRQHQMQGGRKNSDYLWPKSRFISEIIQHRATVIMERNSKPYPSFE